MDEEQAENEMNEVFSCYKTMREQRAMRYRQDHVRSVQEQESTIHGATYEARFGTLRSMIHDGQVGCRTFFTLCEAMHRENPARFDEETIRYLSDMIARQQRPSCIETTSQWGYTLARTLIDEASPKRLILHDALLKTGQLRGMMARGWFSRVTHLALTHGLIDLHGATMLMNNAKFEKLRHLNLAGNRIRSAGASAIGASGSLGALRVIDLEDNEIDEEGASSLTNSAAFEGLEALNLSHNPLEDLDFLFKSRDLNRTLQRLELRKCGVTSLTWVDEDEDRDEGGERQEDAPTPTRRSIQGFEALTYLDLSQNRLGDREGLAEALTLLPQRLTTLLLEDVLLRTESLRALLSSRERWTIKLLAMRGNLLDDTSLPALKELMAHPTLTHLDLRGNNFSNTGKKALDALSKSRPDVTLLYKEE